mgnify:CR=1 FL=1
MTTKKSFFASLFDFSFSNFIAPRIVGIIYGLSIVGVVLALLGIITASLFNGFYGGFFFGLIRLVGTIVISTIVAIVYLLFIRVGLEGLVAGIVTAENSNEIREYVRQIRNENG